MSKSTQLSKPPLHLWVWTLPIAALAMVGWLTFQTLSKKGPVIEITFEDGRGISRGQTLLQYRGIPVGKVIDAKLATDLSQVIAVVQLDQEASAIASEGSQFWVIRPEVSLDGIRGLDTILSGIYIAVEPGIGEPTTSFTGLNAPPTTSGHQDLSIQLVTERAHSVQVGTPIYFRNVTVGEVNQLEISEDGSHITLEANIHQAYAHFLSSESKFWNESGIDVKGGLLGVTIRTDPLETLIKGGISFATPLPISSEETVAQDTVFILHDQADEDWLDWGGNLPVE